MKDLRNIGAPVAFVIALLAAGTENAQAATTVIWSVSSDVNRTSLTITGQSFCTSPAPEVLMFLPPGPGFMSLPMQSHSSTQIVVDYPVGTAGLYVFAVKCGPLNSNYTWSAAVLDPDGGPTLGTNTFTGVQTAPAFVGSGAGLTNLPVPSGVATLGANTFVGSQTITGALHVTADVIVDGNIGAKYQDIAEWVDTAESLPAGTIVVIDPSAHNHVAASTRAYATSVAGAVSGQPGIVLGEPGAGRVLVAQSGRVRIKADARYGAIKAGDLLVSSPTKGFAMRSRPIRVHGERMHRPGTVLGKALDALPAGRGEILVLLTLQ